MPLKKSTYCWLHGLDAKPEYNGNCVQLVRYVRERERWECRPVNWECTTPTIAVRGANLSEQPEERPRHLTAGLKSLADCASQHEEIVAWAKAKGLEPPISMCL